MKYMRNTVSMMWTSVPVTMTGMAGHDPGISGHVRPESLVTLLRNTHYAGFACCLAIPSAISKFVAALIQQAAAASVKHHFTITQMNVLWICCSQQSQHLRCVVR